jgi:hypothetical protein
LQFRDHQLDKIVEPAGQRLRAFPARSERRGDVAKQRTSLCRRRICSSRVPDRDVRRVLSSGKGQQVRIRPTEEFRVHLLAPACLR